MSSAERADVVVIGCGVAGAWTALYLARFGIRDITVLEQSFPGYGASSRGTGLSRVHYANAPEMRLALEGQRAYKAWDEEVGVGSPAWRSTGLLWLVGPEDVDRLRLNVADQVAMGGTASVLSPTELVQLQPHVDPAGIGAALYEPESGTMIGIEAIRGLVSRLLVDGVRVRSRTRVTAIRREGRRVTGVVTADRAIATDTVVLAAGAWSAALAATAGLSLPIVPTRATVGTAFYPPSIEPAMALFDNLHDFAFAPKVGGHWGIVPVRDAGFLSETDPDAIPAPAAGAVEAGLALVQGRIPAMRDAVPMDAWEAADGCTTDRRPIIGAHPELDGLFVHAGGNFKGFKVAPAASRALAELITGSTHSESLIDEFSPGRFDSAPAVLNADDRQYVDSRWT